MGKSNKFKNIDRDFAKSFILDDNTPFAIREAYRALYSNILYLNINSKCKKIVVTSSVSGEGKSTLAINLALTLSQNLEDKRILLIDADMRQPTVRERLSFDKKSHGLSEYLAGIDTDPHFNYVPPYQLMVLTAGGRTVNPTKLIGSERMRQLILACEEEFDYVIIDTPPVNVVADAILLNNIVDGYVISTLAERSNLNSLNDCIYKLNQVGAEIYGIVYLGSKLKGIAKKYSSYNYDEV